ncbi:MAG: hypothetical protein IAE80_09350 [Anaerolinea sp.]|nr:hypothetical protein [Anaerolinea sp.]
MAKSKRVTATAKLTPSEDSDLIAWWNSIPRGSRNAVLKDVMRDYLERNRGGYRPVLPRNVPQPFDPKRFTQISEDTAWIRAALMDLPGYLERVMQLVSAQAASAPPAAQAIGTKGAVNEDAAARCEARMKGKQW